MSGAGTVSTSSLDVAVARLEVQVERLEVDMTELKSDVKAIRAKLDQAAGGWQVFILVGTVGAFIGSGLIKLLSFIGK